MIISKKKLSKNKKIKKRATFDTATNKKKYYIYIILCNKNKLYTGITTDYKRRFMENSGIKSGGAKFTHSFKPISILAMWKTDSRSYASKLEYSIKHLKKAEKQLLIADEKNLKKFFIEKLDIKKYKRIRWIYA